MVKKALKVLLPLLVGAALLVWIYRDFDFSSFGESLSEMNWWWMAASLFFGAMSYIIRGIRWRILLQPMGVDASNALCVNSVNVAYMMNIVIPRIGEVSRCALLKRYDGIAFTSSLGTIVTERAIDMVCILLISVFAFVLDRGVFLDFFETTGVDAGSYTGVFHSSRFYLLAVCVVAALLVLWWLLSRFAFWVKVKSMLSNMYHGAMSITKVRRPWLFIFYTACIWVCYYLHFYLTFYCFGFLSGLGGMAGLVLFVLGSFAVIVPTPNGAGPWHYVVIVGLMMYGISRPDAGLFALVVHTIQTFLVVAMGIASLFLLQFRKA